MVKNKSEPRASHDHKNPYAEVPEHLREQTAKMFAVFGLRMGTGPHQPKLETTDFDSDDLSADLNMLALACLEESKTGLRQGEFLNSILAHHSAFRALLKEVTVNGEGGDVAPEKVLREAMEPMPFALDLQEIMKGTMTDYDPFFTAQDDN